MREFTVADKIKLEADNYNAAMKRLAYNYEIKFDALPMFGDEVMGEKLLELNEWYEKCAKQITKQYVDAVLSAE